MTPSVIKGQTGLSESGYNKFMYMVAAILNTPKPQGSLQLVSVETFI